MSDKTTADESSYPLSLRIDTLAAMLNAELADHPIYDGVELQWFDDDSHGTGMLAFLSRRDDRTVDYYAQQGLTLDERGYAIGGGTRSWNATDFDVAHLEVGEDGVRALVRFTDVDGRRIEVDVDDRDGRRRRRASLLAPVSAGIANPTSLMLVWMPGFDLVRQVPGRVPLIRIDGVVAPIGKLPGVRLHRRHLIKYAAPVCTVELNRDDDVTHEAAREQTAAPTSEAAGLRGLTAVRGPHTATMTLDPPFPEPSTVTGRSSAEGTWHLGVGGVTLTGGTWTVRNAGATTDVALEVTQPWRPHRLPWLMRVVTTVVPVFRQWPTTYVWRATFAGAEAVPATARWYRTGGQDGDSYRRATGS